MEARAEAKAEARTGATVEALHQSLQFLKSKMLELDVQRRTGIMHPDSHLHPVKRSLVYLMVEKSLLPGLLKNMFSIRNVAETTSHYSILGDDVDVLDVLKIGSPELILKALQSKRIFVTWVPQKFEDGLDLDMSTHHQRFADGMAYIADRRHAKKIPLCKL